MVDQFEVAYEFHQCKIVDPELLIEIVKDSLRKVFTEYEDFEIFENPEGRFLTIRESLREAFQGFLRAYYFLDVSLIPLEKTG